MCVFIYFFPGRSDYHETHGPPIVQNFFGFSEPEGQADMY